MKTWLKRLGYALGALVALVLVLVAYVYAASEMRFRKTYSLAGTPVVVPTDSASIARGRHLAVAIAKCTVCHGDQLAGGAVIDGSPMGRLTAPDLTRGEGGLGATLSDADWERAIRHGVLPNGRSVRIMPAAEYQHLADEDVADIIAWARSVAPARDTQPPTHLMLLPRALMVFGQLPLMQAPQVDANAHPPEAMPPSATAEYGRYITQVGGCQMCHGPTLSGGKVVGGDPSWPPAANITPAGLALYTEASFVQTLTTGKRPDGTPLREPMPWRATAQMTPDEFHALWLYLQSVPPKAFGAR
ncbi:MAG TPA: c-type cytochrome [Gemmatimonadaceae bacterium]|nr:c-type cytochrome [Gemmatimonadaceae bacterium]